MERILNTELLRHLVVSIGAAIISYFTPTHGFITALTLAFAFNIFCGIQADKVEHRHDKGVFKFAKVWKALLEYVIYIGIMHGVYQVMHNMGDSKEGIMVAKIITYILLYGYAVNCFKNLIVAYPTNTTIRTLYHLMRLEFKRILPASISDSYDRAEQEAEKDVKKEKEELV